MDCEQHAKLCRDYEIEINEKNSPLPKYLSCAWESCTHVRFFSVLNKMVYISAMVTSSHIIFDHLDQYKEADV